MVGRRVLAATTAVLAGAIVVASVAPAVARPASAPAAARQAAAPAAGTLESTIALNNCSASLVRYPSSQSSDRALMLTNGHCYEGGFPAAGEVLQNRSSSRTGTLLTASGTSSGTVRADRLLYATMTGTDVALYRLTETYAALAARTGRTPLTLATSAPASGTSLAVESGYWKRVWTCAVETTVATVREGDWTWHDSVRYTRPGCEIIGGSSGSPVVDTATGEVIAVNNTINEDGESCTVNNPCEVGSSGGTTATQGYGYAQQTFWFTTCLTSTRTLDLSVSGCRLTKPQ